MTHHSTITSQVNFKACLPNNIERVGIMV
ncbi:hypothetical protein Gohar_017453 [Gossypium harknessii]|uniref:Uncharacterized protein n=1 Tax=Gossypium harknessii TaxID=34285 RepID=A0A7J9G5Z9_9ROSI|nr:hypothetical protein [Gossypium harknessii]